METEREKAFRELCRKLGWKFTCQRYAVYSFMTGTRMHPTADEVLGALHKDYPALGRDSVFRILCDLAEAGVIVRMKFTDPVRFDAEPKRHDHFFCERCGMVYDFQAALDPSPVLAFGTPRSLEVRASGVCKTCLPAQGRK